MNGYRPSSIKARLAMAALTIAVSAGLLETVAGSMLFPDASAVAAREETLNAQAAQAQQLRDVGAGTMRVAGTAAPRS
jgi:hypothetical protein